MLLLIVVSVIAFFVNYAAYFPGEERIPIKAVIIYDIIYILFWFVLIFQKKLNKLL